MAQHGLASPIGGVFITTPTKSHGYAPNGAFFTGSPTPPPPGPPPHKPPHTKHEFDEGWTGNPADFEDLPWAPRARAVTPPPSAGLPVSSDTRREAWLALFDDSDAPLEHPDIRSWFIRKNQMVTPPPSPPTPPPPPPQPTFIPAEAILVPYITQILTVRPS